MWATASHTLLEKVIMLCSYVSGNLHAHSCKQMHHYNTDQHVAIYCMVQILNIDELLVNCLHTVYMCVCVVCVCV